MSKRHYIILPLISLGLLLVAGCSLLGPVKTAPMHTYTLQYDAVARNRARGPLTTLMISSPTASPGYQSRNMIYSCHPFELSHYINNQWAGPPADMLKPLLVQAVRDTGYFHAVISSPISADRNMRLKLNVLELRHDFDRRPSVQRLAVQVTLINDKNDQVIASQVFRADVVAPCPTPYGGVIAANRAAKQVLRQVAAFCVRHIANPKYSVLDEGLSDAKPYAQLPQPHVMTR